MDNISSRFQGTRSLLVLAVVKQSTTLELPQPATTFFYRKPSSFDRKSCKVQMYMDSSAARGILTRQGVGRVKHLKIRTLFLQDLHKQGTKPLSAKRINLLLHWFEFQNRDNESVGKEELQEHRSQAQAKAAVRLIKNKGNFAFAGLLFSGISATWEGLQFQEFQEFQEESFRKEFQEQYFQQESFQSFKEVSFSMSACEQDVMCSDTRACALGQEHVLNMSAFLVGTVKSVGKGTVCDEMFSQLREVVSSLLKRRGVVFSGSTKLPGSLQNEELQEKAMESASSDTKKKDLEQIRSALEENSSVVNELMAAHSRTTTLVQELNSEVKDTKWQLQEMQEADERGRASINEKLKLRIPRERRRPSGKEEEDTRIRRKGNRTTS